MKGAISGGMSNENRKSWETKWYFRASTIVIAILCVGPLALPVVWLSPALKIKSKFFITVILLVFTLVFIKYAGNFYNLLLRRIRELQAVLGT